MNNNSILKINHKTPGIRLSGYKSIGESHPPKNKIEPEKNYKVGGWASVNENTQGPPVWELVENYIRRKKMIQIEKNNSVNVIAG